MEWEKTSKEKYELMLTKIPLFHREITKQVVEKKAPMVAKERGSEVVEEADIVESFFSEVPKAFYSLMVKLMDDVGFDHGQYD